ncbi:glycosyl transferase [Micromonospora sicca]|uniref:Glycosyl transferase n=1 Tax=Micromonospora sicca TaxID=2202420 RepID=A0A317CXM8_9ACTN|nr:glycosyltransferase [Micromonospora sp. 4G51]PWR07169.1 glycosyl transferase [Micromonospora sp. 4G51]
MTPDLTIVVATRNRRDQLLALLPRHTAPVIVVDNGSDDGTPAAVARALPHVRVVELGRNAGAGAARNVGVALADTPFVAFADDDSYWAPGSLERAGELLRTHPRTALLTGRVLVGRAGRLDPISAGMARAPLGTAPDAPGPTVLGFLACAVVLRRAAYRQVGGFAERLGTYGEEALLAMDLAAAGWHLAYVPELVAHHLPAPTGRDPRARRRIEARNRVLTAALRRPGRVVRAVVAETWRDPAGRAGLADAARKLGWVLRQRRPLPAAVEADLATLAAAEIDVARPAPAPAG